MSLEEMFEDVGEFVETVEDVIEDVVDEIGDVLFGEDGDDVVAINEGDDYPPDLVQYGNGGEEIRLNPDGSFNSIKLTPEQQKYFQDMTERLKKENAELQDFIQEQKEHRAINNAPKYGGV